ncbi:UNVERIFIED_CONTAM: Retrovirus-related Pol polyprotein from transposon gypsy [Sesamum radiatum]|uniref:Retrovirus-related Pol polyprotein from transposon gypsy n=1 Tax=Sesamum radiatum TaxID=300843 RepID=A0AAW2JIG6_SESRA
MCIDFTDLNKACFKDSYPLPRIDALIDSTSGCELMSFLDAFQGYNQIRFARDDQEKTSFVIDQGIFCYNVMPFGLKNAGVTYQRLVNNMFREQIGRNMEVYIDDMMVKSQKKENHKQDLQDCFGILQH